jgi:hypothetical protein
MIETTLINELLNVKWKELLRRQLSPDPKEQGASDAWTQTTR